jgi:hypothetical protein
VRRSYSGAASETQLTAVLNGTTAALTIDCEDLSNYPTGASGPFYIVIDRNQVTEEKILCSSRTGNTITVYSSGLTTGRGADGTTVTTHSIGASVEHVFTATDADEANAHVNDTTGNPHPQYLPITTVDAKGDLIVGTAADTIGRLAVGTNGQVLAAASSEATGLGWVTLPAPAPTGGGSDAVFWENGNTVTTNYTITANTNAGSFGPITINSGVTVTVPSGSVWVVV